MANYYYLMEEVRSSDGYTTSELHIWLDEAGPKNGEVPYLGSADLELTYQKGTCDIVGRDEKFKEYAIKNYYSERVTDMKGDFTEVSSTEFAKIAKFFARMERALAKYEEKGLCVSEGGDKLKRRLTMLKLVRAIELEYNYTTRRYQLKT